MQTGVVAFLDILGFSNYILQGESFSENYKKYVDIIGRATRHYSGLDYTLFSDSLVLTTDNAEDEDLLCLIAAISEISFNLLVQLNVPVCGCVSIGSFEKEIDNKNMIITGKPIVEAIEYEKKQNWIGVMVSPSVLKSKPDIRSKISYHELTIDKHPENLIWTSLLYEYEKIPFSIEHFHGFALLPHTKNVTSLSQTNRALRQYRSKINELKFYAPDPYVQHKYSNTKEFIQYAIHSISGVADDRRRIKW